MPDNPFARRAWRALRDQLDALPADAAELVDATGGPSDDPDLTRRLEEITRRFQQNQRDLASELPGAAAPPPVDPGPTDPHGPEIGF